MDEDNQEEDEYEKEDEDTDDDKKVENAKLTNYLFIFTYLIFIKF